MNAPAVDSLTVLRCGPGRRATKLIRRDDTGGIVIDSYNAGALFDVSSRPVSDIYSLNDVLTETSLNPRDFVIRGELKDGVDPRRCPRRLRERADRPPPTFREVPRWWAILDFDKADPARITGWRRGDVSTVALRRLLPPEFHGCSFWWSFSSSSGFKPGASRMKLGFWFSRPVTGDELGRWLASAPVDHAVFRPIQPIFIANPILRGVESPVPHRTGLEQDFRDTVEVPDLREPAPPLPAERRAEQRQHLRTMTAHRFGWPYAVLEDNACALRDTPVAGRNRWGGGGRHHALYCAALRLSGLVAGKHLPAHEVEKALRKAAEHVGIEADEITRTIENAFRDGRLPA